MCSSMVNPYASLYVLQLFLSLQFMNWTPPFYGLAYKSYRHIGIQRLPVCLCDWQSNFFGSHAFLSSHKLRCGLYSKTT